MAPTCHTVSKFESECRSSGYEVQKRRLDLVAPFRPLVSTKKGLKSGQRSMCSQLVAEM